MKRQETPYRQLFDAIPIGLYRRTPDGRLIDVNPAMVHASGYPSREALLAVKVRDMYASEADLKQLRETMERDGVARQFETQLKRCDGSPMWVEINAVAIRGEDGNVQYYEGTITPIERRKAFEFELRRSEQRLRAIMDALDEVVAIVDRDFRFVALMGHRIERLVLPPESLIGKTIAEVLGPEAARHHEEAARRAFAGERVVYEFTTDLLGAPRTFQVSLVPLAGADGQIAGLVGTAYDITDLKQTQQQLASALAEKDALLKELHHRVKNNLQITSSLLNLQFDRVQDPGLRAMVMESQNRIHTMALVHEQLYRSDTLMRLDTRVFLDSLVSSLVRSYVHSGQFVDAKVETEPLPLDLDDAIPIALIINELVSNSLKHAFAGRPSGNRLVVTLRHDEAGRRQLAVVDNGIGMPEGFDLTSTQTLGLSLVSNLARQIGGTVATRTAGGAEFVVTF